MTPTEAFTTLVQATLEPSKARRFAELASSKKGRAKLLDALAHQFESAIRPNAVLPGIVPKMRQSPCYVFHYMRGYGVAFPTLSDAYDDLSADDSWLIVLADGSAGIHRPEARWDAEQVFAG